LIYVLPRLLGYVAWLPLLFVTVVPVPVCYAYVTVLVVTRCYLRCKTLVPVTRYPGRYDYRLYALRLRLRITFTFTLYVRFGWLLPHGLVPHVYVVVVTFWFHAICVYVCFGWLRIVVVTLYPG